jgi:FG-GAP repeat
VQRVFRLRSGDAEVRLPYTAYLIGSWPNFVAIADVNSDGRADVLMTAGYEYDLANDYKLFVFPQADGQLGTPTKLATHNSYPGISDVAGATPWSLTRIPGEHCRGSPGSVMRTQS